MAAIVRCGGGAQYRYIPSSSNRGRCAGRTIVIILDGNCISSTWNIAQILGGNVIAPRISIRCCTACYGEVDSTSILSAIVRCSGGAQYRYISRCHNRSRYAGRTIVIILDGNCISSTWNIAQILGGNVIAPRISIRCCAARYGEVYSTSILTAIGRCGGGTQYRYIPRYSNRSRCAGSTIIIILYSDRICPTYDITQILGGNVIAPRISIRCCAARYGEVHSTSILAAIVRCGGGAQLGSTRQFRNYCLNDSDTTIGFCHGYRISASRQICPVLWFIWGC